MALVSGLLAATKIAGSIAGSILGGAKKSGGRKTTTISKEPIWSSGTTSGGEYLSSGDRKAVFRQSRAKISSSSSIMPSSAIVPSPGGAVTSEGLGMTMGKTLEERVANNEKKITMLKRILNTHIKNPVVGNELEETNRILEDIGNALALDFSNRITQEKDDIAALRGTADRKKRGGAEKGIEAVKKMNSKLGKAFDTVIGPVKGILSRIVGFFTTLAAGWLTDKALKWLSNNQEKVTAFFQFLSDHGKKILIGLGVLIGGVIAVKLVKTVITVVRWVRGALKVIITAYRIARLLLRFGPRALGKVAKAGQIVGTKGGTKVTSAVAGKVAKKGGFKALGMVPVIGNVIDIGMAGYRASQGDWTGAALSLGSAVPGPVGWGFAATDIGRDVMGGGETKGKIGSVADTYNDLVGTSTGMDFSSNIKSRNLEGNTNGGVTIMDPIKLKNEMSGGTSGVSGGVQSSIPLVQASDNSNFHISNTKDMLGISN